jgi:hypothetical protein
MIDRCHLDAEAAAWAEAAALTALENEPDSSERLVETYSHDLTANRSKLKALYDLRLSGEIDAQEFAGLKSSYQEEILKLEKALTCMSNRRDRNRETVKNLFDFAQSAADLFKLSEDDWKRYVGGLLAESYVLTLGKLVIRVHPLLAPLCRLEPPKTPSQRVRGRLNAARFPQLCQRRELNPFPIFMSDVH